MSLKKILAIESSCDDTAVALLGTDGQILADIVYTQDDVHQEFGGVVPEISSRQHINTVAKAFQKALRTASLKVDEIDYVAATFGPGLIGSLLVGFQFARGFALAKNLPLIGIHHLEGHLLAGYKEKGFFSKPFLGLIASGGHTALYLCKKDGAYEVLGETRDDAAGEAFDKVGRMLGLSYPAGKKIDALANLGDPKRFKFPVAFQDKKNVEFSFSGLKTSARNLIEKLLETEKTLNEQTKADICYALRKAIVEALVAKTFLALKKHDMDQLVLGGGVCANSLLRSEMESYAKQNKVKIYIPESHRCVDNAVMIGKAALYRIDHDLVKSVGKVESSVLIGT